MTEEIQGLYHVARVVLLTGERLQRATEENGDPDLYYWDAEISNNLLDSHFTRMNEKTLRNYAEDAKRGVAFLRGHDWHSLPVGYSYDAQFEEGARNPVIASFYTSRSIPDGADLITRMEKKLLRDVSVGFGGGRMVCDVCNEELFECRHYPGFPYEEKKGGRTVKQIATFTIDDARLSEVSGVFDGSTPQAMIRKAQMAARNGTLSRADAALLETRFRVSLPVPRNFTVLEIPGEEDSMTIEESFATVRTMVGATHDDEVQVRVKELLDQVDANKRRIAELEPQAADGAQYRTDLIEEALAEGVRAAGSSFDRDTYETTLKASPIKTIKRFKEDWAKAATAALPAGRSTTEGDGKVVTTNVPLVPSAGFRI